MTQSPYFIRTICLAVFAASVLPTNANAFQDKVDLVIGYEDDVPEDFDPLAGEKPAVTRIAVEAARLAELAGEEVGAKISELIRVLFDGEKTEDERLEAVTELKGLIELNLDIIRLVLRTSPSFKSTARSHLTGPSK